MPWYRTTSCLAGMALILAVNAVVLGGVAYNRSGPPESTLTLSQRELFLVQDRQGSEDSGTALRLLWQTADTPPRDDNRYERDDAAWLDAAKLAALGLDLREPPHEPGASEWSANSGPPADVFLVLEMDGPAYQRALAHARQQAQALPDDKDRQRDFAHERDEASRLFVIDAGLDQGALRQRHPDRARHAIVRGQVSARFGVKGKDKRWTGQVINLAVNEVHVPMPWRAGLNKRPGPHVATLAFGQRLEPWLTAWRPATP